MRERPGLGLFTLHFHTLNFHNLLFFSLHFHTIFFSTPHSFRHTPHSLLPPQASVEFSPPIEPSSTSAPPVLPAAGIAGAGPAPLRPPALDLTGHAATTEV